MYVEGLEAARDFFVRYFGAQSNDGYHNPTTGLWTYFLHFADGARLELMNRPHMTAREAARYPVGYTHIAFALGSRAAVDALTQRLAADGYAVVSGPRTTGDGYYESCVLGPEGCELELSV